MTIYHITRQVATGNNTGPHKIRLIDAPGNSLQDAKTAAELDALAHDCSGPASWQDNSEYRAARPAEAIQVVHRLFIGGKYTGITIIEIETS